MTEQDFTPKSQTSNVESASVKWESPSNIALVKYWGKRENQIPENPSISFTLSNCKTITELTYTKKEGTDFSFDVIFEGAKNAAFKPKIQIFFERVEGYLPFLRDYHFKIETSNAYLENYNESNGYYGVYNYWLGLNIPSPFEIYTITYHFDLQ